MSPVWRLIDSYDRQPAHLLLSTSQTEFDYCYNISDSIMFIVNVDCIDSSHSANGNTVSRDSSCYNLLTYIEKPLLWLLNLAQMNWTCAHTSHL